MTRLVLSVLFAIMTCSGVVAADDPSNKDQGQASSPDTIMEKTPETMAANEKNADSGQKMRPSSLGEPASQTSSLFGVDLSQDIKPTDGTEKSNAAVSRESSDGSNLATIMSGLTLLLIVVIALSWGFKKGNFSLTGAGGLLRIKGGLNLGSKEKIAVISVGGKDLVLGMTQHSISLLYVFEDGINERPGSVSSPPSPQAEVARRFRELLGSDSGGQNGPLGK